MANAGVTYEKGKLYDLNIADVQPDPEQPRKYFDEQALNELSHCADSTSSSIDRAGKVVGTGYIGAW